MMSEGKQQLLAGAFIAALIALSFWGPKLETPVLFGLPVSSLWILFLAIIVLVGIVANLRSPPRGRAVAMLVAASFLTLSLNLSVFTKNEQIRAIHVTGLAAVALSAAMALFLFVRALLRGTRHGAAT